MLKVFLAVAALLLVMTISLVSLGLGYLWGSLNATFVTVSSDPNSGRFLGAPEATWLPNGRDMKLSKDFVFIDSRGRSWIAERDRIVNGASIPQFLWSIVGGPFEGQYRNASIVHDAECERMTAPSSDVHRMFYDACRAGGVREQDAKYLFWAVANFGPSWQIDSVYTVAVPPEPDGASIGDIPPVTTAHRKAEKTPTEEELKWAKKFFQEKNPPIEQVPYLTPPGSPNANASTVQPF